MLKMWRAPTLAQLAANRFLLIWNLAAVVTFVAPLLIFTVARSGADDGDDGDQQDDQNGDGDDWEDGQQQSHWWQFWRTSVQYDEDDEQRNDSRDDAGVPWWWIFNREEREPDEEGEGTLLFVYLWTLLLLGSITYYGNNIIVVGQRDKERDLVWALWGYLNFGFTCCTLVSGLGAVAVEGREIEETGWYGQTSVLVFLTSVLAMLHSVVFLIWIHRRGVTWCDDDIEYTASNNEFGYRLDKTRQSSSISTGVGVKSGVATGVNGV